MKKFLSSDWNQTLIEEKDDKNVLKQIGMDELWHSIFTADLEKLRRLRSLKGEIEAVVKEYRGNPEAGEKILRESYRLYGKQLIPGMPKSRILRSINKHASRAVNKLDGAFYELCDAAGGDRIFILTVALSDGVYEVAERSGRKPSLIVDGSDIIYNGKTASGFDMKNYDDKHIELKEMLEYLSASGQNVYMGDDFRDERCAEVVDIFVVAPLATDGYRQMMANKYGSKVRTPSRKGGEVCKALTMD